MNRMETKEKRKVTFEPDVEQTYLLDGKWSFLRYFVLVIITSSLSLFVSVTCTRLSKSKSHIMHGVIYTSRNTAKSFISALSPEYHFLVVFL